MRRWPRLLLRVYLYGILMLAFAMGASFLVGNYLLRPAVDIPARPSTAWIAWHMMERTAEPDTIRRELQDLKRRSRIELSLYESDGRLIATNAEKPPAPLPVAARDLLPQQPTHFADGSGVVAAIGADGKVVRYAQVRYPLPALPLGIAATALLTALGVLALLSIPFARSVTAPVERLTQLTRAFGAGDLRARSRSERRDEIGDLARTFDEMADRVVTLRRSEKELLANVSHELRTPLARIRLALDLVRGGDVTRANSYLTDIEEDLAELEQLLDGIMTTARLDLARGSGGETAPPLRQMSVDGRSLLDAARSRFAIRYPDRSLAGSVAPDVPAVSGDPALLRRVLDNLLDNAAKFSEPSDSIELCGTRGERPDSLVIHVRDHGMGIAPENMTRVFEPFFRGDRSRTRATGGVGLGLTVARRIVEAHEGTITVRSTKDEGTEFCVTVPVRKDSLGLPRVPVPPTDIIEETGRGLEQ